MAEKILWFVIGLTVGAIVGVVVMSLCVAASNSSRRDEEEVDEHD